MIKDHLRSSFLLFKWSFLHFACQKFCTLLVTFLHFACQATVISSDVVKNMKIPEYAMTFYYIMPDKIMETLHEQLEE